MLVKLKIWVGLVVKIVIEESNLLPTSCPIFDWFSGDCILDKWHQQPPDQQRATLKGLDSA